MAKKIKIDFSKTEERSGWNTREIPEGIYGFKIEGVQETEASDGTSMLVYALVPTDAKYKTRRFPYYCKLQQNQFWKLRDLLVAAGETVPKRAISIDPEKVVGKTVAAEVEDDSYNGSVRSSIAGVYGPEILDDEDGDTEDSEEEEYDESESEEEYEVEEDEEADDEDDLDDDELEDEDLEDEDFEEDDEDEEEEEPAPAPRRRAPAKAPVKKAPAAPAARRVVKRR